MGAWSRDRPAAGAGPSAGEAARARRLRPTQITRAAPNTQMAAPTVNADRRPSSNPSPAAIKNALAQVSRRAAVANEGPRAQPL